MVSFSARPGRVTVYDTAISAAFWPGGSIYDNMRRISWDNLAHAQRAAPVRTGRMRASMYRVLTPVGRFNTRYTIDSTVDYLPYTVAGTTGPIFPNKSVFLWVRPAPFSYYTQRTPRMFVKGQAANDWPDRALRATMYDHGLI